METSFVWGGGVDFHFCWEDVVSVGVGRFFARGFGACVSTASLSLSFSIRVQG